ncbi:MAG: hypothetical protein ACI4DQ_05380 [Lachnospiraceae bacterium]
MTTKEIPISVGVKLLAINRTSIYDKGMPVCTMFSMEVLRSE